MKCPERIRVQRGQGGRSRLARRGRALRLIGAGRVMSGGRTTEAGILRSMGKGPTRAGRAGEVGCASISLGSAPKADHSSPSWGFVILPTAPENNDHFGLTLILPRLVRVITLIGSADLGNVVASEHSQLAGEESWQLYTVREDGSGGWVSIQPFSCLESLVASGEPFGDRLLPLVRNRGVSPTLLLLSHPPDPVSSPSPSTLNLCSDDKSTHRRASRKRGSRCRFARSSLSVKGGRGQRCRCVGGTWTGGRYRGGVEEQCRLAAPLLRSLTGFSCAGKLARRLARRVRCFYTCSMSLYRYACSSLGVSRAVLLSSSSLKLPGRSYSFSPHRANQATPAMPAFMMKTARKLSW